MSMSDLEYRQLIKRYRDGSEEARKSLLDNTEWLVASVVSHYDPDLPEELISAGRAGFLRAADKFKLEESYKFLTYATWWIRHYVEKELGLEEK